MNYDAVLTDLPVMAHVTGEDISSLYVSELRNVKTEEELEGFTKRWEALWKLPYGHQVVSEAEESIVNNSYDKTEALHCMMLCRTGVCEHSEGGNWCPGMYIILPPIMMQCFILAKEFQVPFNVAIVQLQKALNNLPDHVAFEVF